MTRLGYQAALAALLVAIAALGKGPVPPVNASGGVAVKGYGPVAYFEEAGPVKGSKEHSFEWNGASWRFSSAENLSKFQRDPERSAPQFGGYCAWAVSNGYTADVDPQAWTVRSGKMWLEDSTRALRRRSAIGPGCTGESPASVRSAGRASRQKAPVRAAPFLRPVLVKSSRRRRRGSETTPFRRRGSQPAPIRRRLPP